MEKYKNSKGIELSLTQRNNDFTDLLKEVVSEAVSMIERGENKDTISTFLNVNFNLKNVRSSSN